MGLINPTFPTPHDLTTAGTWGETEIAAFQQMVDAINAHDQAIEDLVVSGALSVTDNGDGSVSIDPNPGAYLTENSQVGTAYTLVLDDAQSIIENAGSNVLTVTIPTNANVPYPLGSVVEFFLYGTGSITLQGDVGVTLRSPAGPRLVTQYASAAIRLRSADEWVVSGFTVF